MASWPAGHFLSQQIKKNQLSVLSTSGCGTYYILVLTALWMESLSHHKSSSKLFWTTETSSSLQWLWILIWSGGGPLGSGTAYMGCQNYRYLGTSSSILRQWPKRRRGPWLRLLWDFGRQLQVIFRVMGGKAKILASKKFDKKAGAISVSV